MLLSPFPAKITPERFYPFQAMQTQLRFAHSKAYKALAELTGTD